MNALIEPINVCIDTFKKWNGTIAFKSPKKKNLFGKWSYFFKSFFFLSFFFIIYFNKLNRAEAEAGIYLAIEIELHEHKTRQECWTFQRWDLRAGITDFICKSERKKKRKKRIIKKERKANTWIWCTYRYVYHLSKKRKRIHYSLRTPTAVYWILCMMNKETFHYK